MNFEGSKEYRRRVQYQLDMLFDPLVKDHFTKGGNFDAQKFTRWFHECFKAAQLMVDLSIGTGVHPLRREKDGDEDDHQEAAASGTGRGTTLGDRLNAQADAIRGLELPVNRFIPEPNTLPVREILPSTSIRDEVRDFGAGNTEGPGRRGRDEIRVSRADSGPDQADDHGPARSGQEHTSQLEPISPITGPGTGRGHSGGPTSLEIHTTPDNGPVGTGQGVPDVRGQHHRPEDAGSN